MRIDLLLLALVGCSLSSAALAEPCAAPFRTDQLLDQLDLLEESLHEGDHDAVREAATTMEQGLPCLDVVQFPATFARAYRGIAAGRHAAGDDEGALRWYRTAHELDPTFRYDDWDLAPDSPLRGLYQAAVPEDEPVPVPARALGEGEHHLDGRPVTAPEATTERPHVYQLEHEGVRSWVIDGHHFPDEVLVEAAVSTRDRRRRRREPVSEYELEPRDRPAEKTPLIIGGLVGVLAGGAVYVASTASHRSFGEADSVDEVDRLRVRTNRLFLASGVALAVGGGTATYGIVLQGRGAGFGVRF